MEHCLTILYYSCSDEILCYGFVQLQRKLQHDFCVFIQYIDIFYFEITVYSTSSTFI